MPLPFCYMRITTKAISNIYYMHKGNILKGYVYRALHCLYSCLCSCTCEITWSWFPLYFKLEQKLTTDVFSTIICSKWSMGGGIKKNKFIQVACTRSSNAIWSRWYKKYITSSTLCTNWMLYVCQMALIHWKYFD